MPFSGTDTFPTLVAGVGTNNALKDVAPAADTSTTCTWATGAAASWIQAKPGAANSTVATPVAGQNNGWNVLAADMDATANLPANRTIPAGTWTCAFSLSATAIDVLNSVYQVQVFLHKRAVGGGLTQIGNALSLLATFALSPATFTVSVTGVAAQLFAPGETVQVEVWLHGQGQTLAAQTLAVVLGAVTKIADPGLFNQFPRSPATESVPIGVDTVARVFLPDRKPAVSIPIAPETVTRATVVARTDAENVAIPPETATRSLGAVRAPPAESIPIPPESVTRAYTAARAPSVSVPIGVDVVVRAGSFGRSPVESITIPPEVLARALIYGRSDAEYPPGVAPDYTGSQPGFHIQGTVRNEDATATPIAGATVQLVRISDLKVVQTTTSAADGTYSFPRDQTDVNTYTVIAFLAGSPQLHGTSDRGLLPA